jgi:putative flippase GtrA
VSEDRKSEPKPPDVTDSARQPFSIAELARHHAASGLATGVDFGIMIALVERLHLAPVFGTAIGSSVGAVTNFWMGRHWTYHAENVAVGRQVLRYVIVAVCSLGWNTFGEYIFVNRLGVHYVLGRVITAIIVSNAWNYPMQRFFVFRHPVKRMPSS